MEDEGSRICSTHNVLYVQFQGELIDSCPSCRMEEIENDETPPSIPGRCIKHPAFDWDYCPGCGTQAKI